MYKVFYHPEALKKLKRIHPNDRKRILEKIIRLSQDPQNPTLDVKKLASTKRSFRLRTGDIRAIFEVNKESKTIYIWDIDYRGSIY
jgi:mRNA interferase RelE/StbE